MSWAESKILSSLPGVVHGFGNRDVSGDVSEIAESFGLTVGIARLTQVHGSRVIVVRHDLSEAGSLPEGDAVVTGLRGMGVAVSTADCVPVLLADKGGGVVAAVHAGWRGTLSGIVRSALRVIGDSYGIEPSRMNAVLGPSIRSCCYEVGEDVVSLFRAEFDDWGEYISETARSRFILDLSSANVSALLKAGVSDIEIVDVCTRCDEDFYSYRREGKGVGSQLSVIGLV